MNHSDNHFIDFLNIRVYTHKMLLKILEVIRKLIKNSKEIKISSFLKNKKSQ
jgi:hypothetical protein